MCTARDEDTAENTKEKVNTDRTKRQQAAPRIINKEACKFLPRSAPRLSTPEPDALTRPAQANFGCSTVQAAQIAPQRMVLKDTCP